MMGLANSKEAARAFALLFKTAAQHFDGVCGSLFGLTAARSVLLEMQESGGE